MEDNAHIYSIKEIYYTLQGEGFHSGRAAIFCRFSGCNLWTGLEKNRSKAICKFCDTDFFGTDGQLGGKYTAQEIVDTCLSLWPKNTDTNPFIVCTGGEPALQLDENLIYCLKKKDFEIAIETNGTLQLASGIDWICISPKAHSTLELTKGNEIKIVYPQKGLDIKSFENQQFDHFFIQAMDDENLDQNTIDAIHFCKSNPKWKLSLQSHKYLKIP